MQQQEPKPDRLTKPETIQQKQLEWRPYEAGGENAMIASIVGYELIVALEPPAEDDHSGKPDWSWTVQITPTGRRKTPEVLASGIARSEGGAKIAAKESLNRERRLAYQKAREFKAPKSAPKPEPPTKPELNGHVDEPIDLEP